MTKEKSITGGEVDYKNCPERISRRLKDVTGIAKSMSDWLYKLVQKSENPDEEMDDLPVQISTHQAYYILDMMGFLKTNSDAILEALASKSHLNSTRGQSVDVEGLKDELRKQLSQLIPHSYSDNTMLHTIDYLTASGYKIVKVGE